MNKASVVRNLTTRRGATLPFTTLGFGSAPLGNFRRALAEDEAVATVRAAWDMGLRHFDTAPLYGHSLSELRVGAALRGEPRDSYLLSTKVGRLLEPCAPGEEDSGFFISVPPLRIRYDYSYDAVMRSLEESLARLGLDRVDILYVHDVDSFTHGSLEASDARIAELMDTGGWRALDELRAAGVVAAIGAGVNECRPCERLMELADPDVFLLAGRYTLLEQGALDTFLPGCEARGIGVVIGGPFNSGVLATGARKGASFNYGDAPPEVLRRVAALEAVCDRHSVPLPRAALAFPLAHPSIVSVVPGGMTPDEVARNVATLDERIPDDLWADLRSEGLIRADAPTPQTVN